MQYLTIQLYLELTTRIRPKWKMKLILVVLASLSLSSYAFAQIPYSYATGRDVAAVNRRYNAFQAAKADGASADELQGICGPLRLNTAQQICTTKVGRPKDSETASCDVFCCLAGHKVGNCGTKVGVKVDEGTVAAVLAGSSVTPAGVLAAIPGLIDLSASCRCLDSDVDVKCGPDGSFWGIRCPFDGSACWRSCCREGKSNGKCGGFLSFKCKCS